MEILIPLLIILVILLVIVTLVALVLGGFALRARGLSAEGLADDELNKLDASVDYRTHGLTGANGEHPFLMKALLTASVRRPFLRRL